MSSSSRRDFIKKTCLSAALIPFVNVPVKMWDDSYTDDILSVNIFSKHLQFLDYRTTGKMAAEMGFSGVDLTVRPKGHVLPESVKVDLPKAVKEINKGGSNCELITTSIESVDNQLDLDILQTAAKVGVKYYRTNWYKYLKDKSMQEALEMYQTQIQELGKVNRDLGLVGCYQNHAGMDVGSSFWEIKQLLNTVDPDYFGTQYDIRHAMVEGGFSWENGLKLLKSHIKVIVLKDFKWGKVNGKWQVINTPIGEGMVDFDKYFKLLKKYQLKPPVSLHLEYDLGGAEKGLSEISIPKETVYDAMKKDLSAVQEFWKNA